MKITWTLLLVAGLTNWGALRGEESTPPRDPTADARLTISDWEKAADDVKETMNPSNDTGPRAVLERFKRNLDTDKDSSMSTNELDFALRELRHGHPYLENQVRKKIRENNPITPR